MKRLSYIISFFLFLGCQSELRNDSIIGNSILSTDADKEETLLSLSGYWYLTNYFDTIVVNRELAKYRLQTPTWFAIILHVDNDSISMYGSIGGGKCKINFQSDTLATIYSEMGRDNWWLINAKTRLLLVQCPNQERPDSTIYIYCKNNEFKNLIELGDVEYLNEDKITEYYNENIFKGEYLNETTNTKIVFGLDKKMRGLKDFDTYEVGTYFWTFHPYHNLDVITFTNSSTSEYKQYNWKFIGNKLILTEFVNGIITKDGETHIDYYSYVLGSEKIELKMLEKE